MFFKWMDGCWKCVEAYVEESIIKKELEEKGLDLSIEEFREVSKKLIEEGILIIDYFPRRRRVGRRKSQPAEWIYKITHDALGCMGYVIFDLLKRGDKT